MNKVLVFLAEGFEEIEALTVVDVLRRADIKCDTCSIQGKIVTGAHNIKVEADKIIDNIVEEDYNALILPGGMPGSDNLRNSEKVLEIVRNFNKSSKLVSAICAAPIVLAKAGIIKERKITSYPGFDDELKDAAYYENIVVEDENLVTSRGPATAIYFALKLVEKLRSKEVSNNLKEGMMLKFVEEEIKTIK